MALQTFNSHTFEANTFEAGLWTGASVLVADATAGICARLVISPRIRATLDTDGRIEATLKITPRIRGTIETGC